MAHSCNGHLIKRVITQHPQALTNSVDVAGANVIEGLVDSKPSVVASCHTILNDCWMACPEEMDVTFKESGLMNSNEKIQLQCLDILISRVSSIPNISFKIFTPSVVHLLNSSSSACSRRASDLLILFFKNAKDGAKEDLAKEMSLQGIKEASSSSILTTIGFKPSAKPNSQMSTPNQTSSILNIEFLTNDPQYAVEQLSSEQVFSADSFKRDITEMMTAFEGKETEFNWQQREKHISRLRAILRGNGAVQFLDSLIWGIKFLVSGILKAANSLRTTLSSGACQFIKEMAIILGHNIDPIADTFLANIMKMTALSKKITHTNANITSSAIIANSSYSIRTVNHILSAMNEKNIQPRLYCGKWIRIILCRHRIVKSSMESSGGREIMETCIIKGLSDASPGVREEMRQAFWAFNEVWPNSGRAVLARLDNSIKKALEKSNPQPFDQSASANAKATRAAPSSLKDFIAQSRERNTAHGMGPRKQFEREKVEKVDPPKDISARPARLGLSQRAQRRVPPTAPAMTFRSANATTSLSQNSTSQGQKAVGRDGARNNIKSLDRPSGLTSSPDEGPTKEKPPVPGATQNMKDDMTQDSTRAINEIHTIADQIKSEDPVVLLKGVEAISECWKTPHESSGHLPSPDIMGRFFKQVFSSGSNMLLIDRLGLILVLTHPGVIVNLMQFVPVTEIALGIVQAHSDQTGVNSLEVLIRNVASFQEQVSLCVYVISKCLEEDDIEARDPVIIYCFQVLNKNLASNADTPSIKEDLTLLESVLDSVTSGSLLVRKYKELLSEIIKSEDSIGDISPPKTLSATKLVVANEPEALMSELAIENSHAIDLSEIAEPPPSARPIEKLTLSGSHSSNSLEVEHSSVSEFMIKDRDQGVESESEVVSTALYFNEEARDNSQIEIFEDSRDSDIQTLSSSTVLLGRQGKISNEIDWLKTETESKYSTTFFYFIFETLHLTISLVNACSLSLEEDSPSIISQLIDQLSRGEIQIHGFNKLITLVKDLDGESKVMWKEKGWFSRIKVALFQYNETKITSQFSSEQANRVLLLLNHLMVANSDVFCGEEETIMKILLAVHDISASDKRSLIRGALSVRDELVSQNPHSRPQLLKVAFYDFEINWDQPSTSSPHKVFLLSTLAEAGKQPFKLEVLEPMNTVITTALRSRDAAVRKEVYPLLLSLMHEFSSNELFEERIVRNLKEGEKKLLEYYLTANNT